MTDEERKRDGELRLRNYYTQIHLTVIYEKEFVIQLKTYRALEYYRNEILDNINRERRQLGYLL